MATEQPGKYDEALRLLRAGKTQEADDLLSKLRTVEAQAAAARGEPPEPAQPRKPEEVILDTFKAIHNLLGTSPALTALMHELEDVLGEKPPAATS